MTAGEVGDESTPPVPRPPDGWWPIVWYPLALPVAFIITVWSATGIHPVWLVLPIALTVGLVALLTVGMSLLLADRHRGGAAALALTLATLIAQPALRTGLLVLALVVIGEGLAHRGKRWRNGRRITRFLSVLGATLLIVAFAGTLQQGSLQDAVADVRADLDARHADAFDPAHPDIYVLLLDGYPGDDAATIAPWFDASAFPSALEGRGFDVERHARSNYLTTRLSVPTMLANEHIDDSAQLDPPYGNQAADARRLREFGDNGVILSTLRRAGYETITIASPSAHLGLRRVDRVIDPSPPNEFDRVLLTGTAIGPTLDGLAPDLFAAIARGQVLSAFGSAEAVAAEAHDRPRFVWVHVLAPHPPLVFHADGTPVANAPALITATPDLSSREERRVRTLATFDYASFVARRTEELLDRMLASVKRDSVIVIFSDHGTDIGFDPLNPPASDLNERTSIVLALRSPGHPNLLPAGTTPIGVLPRVLNTYLGTSLPIRADTSWGWPHNGSLLEAIPIDLKTVSR